MTATLPPMIKFQPLSPNGVIPGGKVYTYAAGTSTPQATYQSDGVTPNTNPIILDANGACDMQLGTGLAYKINLTDAAGNQISGWPLDNISSSDSPSALLASKLASTTTGRGDALIGVLQPYTGAVARTQHEKNAEVITAEDFGATGNGTADDSAAVQAAITALLPGQTLRLIGDYKITGTGLLLTNKTRVTISGPGRLKLVGAAVNAVILNLVGTCDDILISGVRFEGDGNAGATYFQYGVWNASGQTISNVRVMGCLFKNLNLSVSFNADAGGSVINCYAIGNTIEDMLGTLGGQGYGLHASKATGVQFCNNIINRCSRHSIYVARGAVSSGTDYGVLVHDNVIRDHRSVGYDATHRPAIFCARGFGYSIRNNKIIGYYDGAISVSQDTVDGTSCGDCVISGNELYGRKNAVPSISVGETSNPTTYRINNVDISNNTFMADISVGGYAQEVSIPNGLNVNVVGNNFYVANITNIAYRPIVIGEYSAQGALDLDRVNILRNTFNGSSAYIPVRFVYCGTAICGVPAGGAARVRIAGNEIDNALLNSTVEFQAAQTNKKIVAQDQWGGIAGVYTAADTAPTVFGGVTYMVVLNSGAVSITTLADPSPYQVVTLVFGDSNTTIKHATGNIRLAGGADFASSSRDTLTLLYSPVYAQWLEFARAANG